MSNWILREDAENRKAARQLLLTKNAEHKQEIVKNVQSGIEHMYKFAAENLRSVLDWRIWATELLVELGGDPTTGLDHDWQRQITERIPKRATEKFTWYTEDCNFRSCDECEHLRECDDAEPDRDGDRRPENGR